MYPSKPYLRETSYPRQIGNPGALLVPLENDEDSTGSGSGRQEATCSYSNVQQYIKQAQWMASNCVDKVEFQNCCEPKFFSYTWQFSRSTIYPIKTPYKYTKFVSCDLETDGGGWMVILRRGYKNKFRYSWAFHNYRRSFGRVDRDYWMGLKAVHFFTSQEPGVELRIELKRNGHHYFAHYSNFSLGNRSTGYVLHVGGYNQNSSLPDSLSYSNGFPFDGGETYRPDNPVVVSQYVFGDCSYIFLGGWWFGIKENETCTRVSLFTDYSNPIFQLPGKPMWEMDGKKVGFDYVEMKIRPKTLECGLNINQYSEYVVKKAFLHPEF